MKMILFSHEIFALHICKPLETLYVFRCVVNNNDIIIVVLLWLKTRKIT